MLNPISAELLKLRRHRSTWMLVWIFPIGAIVIPLIVILAQLGQGSPPAGAADASAWYRNATGFWGLAPDTLGRFLVGSFVAVAFAGEYGWNTWKLIVPHRARSALLIAKYVVALGLVYLAFLLASQFVTALTWVEDVATGDPIPDGITAAGLVGAHLTGLLAGLPTILFTVALAAFASILTRSTTAAIVIGIVYVVIEQLFRALGPALALYLPGPVEALYRVLPGYHLGNIVEWATDGQAAMVPFPSGTIIADDLTTSLAIVAAWIVSLVGVTFWRFGRQDIN